MKLTNRIPIAVLPTRSVAIVAGIAAVALAIAAIACTSDDEAAETQLAASTTTAAAMSFTDRADAAIEDAVGMSGAIDAEPIEAIAATDRAEPAAAEITTSTITFEASEPERVESANTTISTGTGGIEGVEIDGVTIPVNATINVGGETLTGDVVTIDPRVAMEAMEMRLIDIWESSIDGVVLIELGGVSFFSSASSGLGAGWFWDEEGHIVTNYHVVRPNVASAFGTPSTITVETFDGDRYEAEFVAGDRVADIAVIKIDAAAGVARPLAVGDSAELKPGMTAIALGHPFGVDQAFSMTNGIISGLAREMQSDTSPIPVPAVIQTDADMNPGNSGGPLLNSAGEVIGVSTQIRSLTSTNSGVGFATPINLVRRVVNNLITDGTHEYSLIGISSQIIDAEVAAELGLDAEQRGLLVVGTSPDGPAARAGIVADTTRLTTNGQRVPVGDGDIIVRIDNVAIEDLYDLRSYIMLNTSPGDTIIIEVLRDGETIPIDVTLASWGDQYN